MNPILPAADFNIRWLMRWLAIFWCWILAGVLRPLGQRNSDAFSNLKHAAA